MYRVCTARETLGFAFSIFLRFACSDLLLPCLRRVPSYRDLLLQISRSSASLNAAERSMVLVPLDALRGEAAERRRVARCAHLGAHKIPQLLALVRLRVRGAVVVGVVLVAGGVAQHLLRLQEGAVHLEDERELLVRHPRVVELDPPPDDRPALEELEATHPRLHLLPVVDLDVALSGVGLLAAVALLGAVAAALALAAVVDLVVPAEALRA